MYMTLEIGIIGMDQTGERQTQALLAK